MSTRTVALLTRERQAAAVAPSSFPVRRNHAGELVGAAPSLFHGVAADFGRIPIQPKLTVSDPGDVSEQEAERVADTIMTKPDRGATVQRACSHCAEENETLQRLPDQSHPSGNTVLWRMIRSCDMLDSQPCGDQADTESQPEENASSEPIARQAANGTQALAAPGLSASIGEVCRSGGQPLSTETRQFMEPRFGHEFASVRVHTDPTASDLARQVQARAFTTGNHLFFASGEYQPHHADGKRLLAHELTHVIQQSKGGDDLHRHIQRMGNGATACPVYADYDKSVDLSKYNCAGLAHRTYDFKSLADTKAALAKGSSQHCSDAGKQIGAIKHWLWEYDIVVEDAAGNKISKPWRDFHTIGGPTDGDPVVKDSSDYFTKNGPRKVYGPGPALNFKPAAKDQARTPDPADQPMTDAAGRPIYKVRSNITETCYCLPCPKASKSP